MNSLKKQLLKKLQIPDAFAGWHSPKTDREVIGWCDVEALQLVVAKANPQIIIEVGSWYGKSTTAMLQAASPQSCVICVDTWLGSLEHWIDYDYQLQLLHGRPSFYNSFLENIYSAGLAGQVIPLSMTSDTAFEFLKKREVCADLIYLDGSHETAQLTDDLTNATEVLSLNGAIVGDDLDWHSVEIAVEWFRNMYPKYKFFNPNSRMWMFQRSFNL